MQYAILVRVNRESGQPYLMLKLIIRVKGPKGRPFDLHFYYGPSHYRLTPALAPGLDRPPFNFLFSDLDTAVAF